MMIKMLYILDCVFYIHYDQSRFHVLYLIVMSPHERILLYLLADCYEIWKESNVTSSLQENVT